MLSRDEHLGRLREEAFDLLVVGGGISGAATARDAASRGFRTALVEARDFAEGTSSRSSRLIHGGLRYLEHLELDLVFEASRERGRLLRLAPHLVRPLEFFFPIYEDGRVGRLKLDAGMWLYDALALFRNIERHQMLEPEEVLEREPGLRSGGLLGGARYFDAQVDDARLVVTTVLAAAEEGAAVANRVEVREIRTGDWPGHGAVVRDLEGGEEWRVDALAVVIAAGPWTDAVRERAGEAGSDLVRPTRGSHIQVPRTRVGHQRALIFESALDGRIMFVLPWTDLTLIGTTDEFHEGPPEAVVPTAGDVSYLLESTNRLFPKARLTGDDVIGAWAGLRPLVAEAGSGGGPSAGDVSRDFVVREAPPGVFTLAGGKLTSHRAMGEEAVDRAAEFLADAGVKAPDRSSTAKVPLPGGDFEELEALEAEIRERAAGLGVGGTSARRLTRAYGTRAADVLALAEGSPELAERVTPDRPELAAEAVWAVRREMALHVEDFAYRRTNLALETRPGAGFEGAMRRAAELMGEASGWSRGRIEAEVARVRRVRAGDDAYREGPARETADPGGDGRSDARRGDVGGAGSEA